MNIARGGNFVLADYRAREGFVTAETGENLLAREIICENKVSDEERFYTACFLRTTGTKLAA